MFTEAEENNFGASENSMLTAQNNLAATYNNLGQTDKSLRMYREVYSGRLRLNGDEDEKTLLAANNYAMVLLELQSFEEAKKVLRRTVPVARRVLGAEHALTLSLREDLSRATLGGASSAEEKREALRILEEVAGVMRRVFGPAHPETLRAQRQLEHYRGSH